MTPLQNMRIWDQQAEKNDAIVEQLSAEDIKGVEPDEAVERLRALVYKSINFRCLREGGARVERDQRADQNK